MAELEDSISEPELRKWQTFYGLEPWGSDVEFYRTGIIASMIGNTAAMRKPGAKAFTPADFMPKPKQAPTSGLDPKRVRASLFEAFGDRLKPKK